MQAGDAEQRRGCRQPSNSWHVQLPAIGVSIHNMMAASVKTVLNTASADADDCSQWKRARWARR
jgi:hypothetical protein